jgi:protein-S-isoprenylcysteine O-methyltransferase Ste14
MRAKSSRKRPRLKRTDNPAGAGVAAPPSSATHPWVALAGAAAFLAAIAFVVNVEPFAHDLAYSAMLVIAITSAVIFLLDLGWQKVQRRPSTGMDLAFDDPSWPRTLTKFLGLLASIGAVGFAYWLFPEYHGDLYTEYWRAIAIVIGPWLVLAIPYLHAVDRRMREPRDGYWQMGALVTGRWRETDVNVLTQHALGWIIKGYFLALMFSFLCHDLEWLFLFDMGTLRSFEKGYQFLYRFMFLLDVGLATLGYVMAFRVTDTHIRSAEPTMLGWAVALACYEPFWSLISRHYLPYDSGHPWGVWLSTRPALLVAWGSVILLLSAVYVWSTVMFGARFSNLTHRGIITAGPYRYSKHPAYIAKNITWWMIAVPFLPQDNLWDTLPRCAMLLAVNLIYFMRAKTEEWHLSRDPEYVRYALWIEQHGLLRFLRRIPIVGRAGYRRPEGHAASA